MATSGKKGKKKVKSISLQHFLSNGNSQPGVTQVAKKVRNRDDSDEEDVGALPQFYQLPTAPRANRIYEDDSVPHKPPFLAYISNLPFDIKDDDIYEFFNGYKIESVRLPREDGEHSRLRGFGYIQFQSREDLIDAISLPDPQIMNRRIRINVASENDQPNKRGSNNRNRYEGFGTSAENKDSSNWRRGGNSDRDGGENNKDRRSGYSYNRDRERAPRDASGSGEAGSWRTENRPIIESTSPSRRGGFGDRFSGRRGNDEFRSKKQDDEPPQERPKLKLQPRTLPLPQIEVTAQEPENKEEKDLEKEVNNVDLQEEQDILSDRDGASTPEQSQKPIPKPTGVAPEKIFGSAKPVDTAARQKEIEERLEKERIEKLKKKEEDEEKEKTEKEAVVDEKLDEKHTEKDEKENKNAASWRKRDDDVKPNYEPRSKYSPDRRGGHLPPRRHDDRRTGGGGGGSRDVRDRRDRDYNRRDGNYDHRENRNTDNRDNYNRGGGGRDRNDRGGDRDRNDRGGDRGYNKDRRGGGDRDRRRDSRDRDHNRDNRHRDDKPKQRDRDNNRPERPEKPMPKYQPPQGGPVLSTSNKYSVFQDQDDVSE